MKKNELLRCLILILVVLLSIKSWARGGGGCFEQGTLISGPQGTKPIESLRPGDWVWSNVAGRYQKSQIKAISTVTPQYYEEIKLSHGLIHVTDEHLFATKPGEFTRAADLKPGDRLIMWNNKWQNTPILSVAKIRAVKPAYNLLVEQGATYFANHILVHNKGCFLPNTPILLGDGSSKEIRLIQRGDSVQAFEIDGRIVVTQVEAVLKHQVDSYYTVSTSSSKFNVTEEHPFYVGNGKFKTLEALKVHDVIYILRKGKLQQEPIITVEKKRNSTWVYNLQTAEPHTYFAADIAVHNKGGGGGGGGRGGGGGGGRGGSNGSSENSLFFWVFVIWAIGYGIYSFKADKIKNLDYIYLRRSIESKAKKTTELLEFLAVQEPVMKPELLKKRAGSTFILLQQCWSKRDYTPMQTMLMPTLYSQHCKQIAGMLRNHEINHLDRLEVISIDLVNIRYTEDKQQREFTALFTAKVRDYYTDDRSGRFLRGDNSPALFQEFWTFQWQESLWLLRDIEQSGESDYLIEENFVEQFTDGQIEKIYQDKVDNLGVVGPWLPKSVETKANKVDRMLNFLVQSNKIWNRQDMINRVRLVFTHFHLALEAGELAPDGVAELYPDMAAEFIQIIEQWKILGNVIEYRNFCIRKVEIVLVKHFDDTSQNEFTARITAHAQRIHLRNGSVITRDDDVTLFEEYWTFGVLDGEWKLKEALPNKAGENAVTSDNFEEGSSPDLVKWYYTKKRAI